MNRWEARHAMREECWPWWARLIGRWRQTWDAGVGDTAARLIGPRLARLAHRLSYALRRKDCGCGSRQARWNARYGYRNWQPNLRH